MSHQIFFVFDNILKYVFKLKTTILKGNTVLDLNTFEANLYTFFVYILVILFSSFTYKFIEMRYYKK